MAEIIYPPGHEREGQIAKLTRDAIAILDTCVQADIGADMMREFQHSHWRLIGQVAGVPRPSDETIQLVFDTARVAEGVYAATAA